MPRRKETVDSAAMIFLPDISSDLDVDDLQEDIYDAIAEGREDHRCACCGQITRVYKRRPDQTALAILVDVVVEYYHTKDWVDITSKIKGSVGSFMLWKHWGFIDLCEDLNREGKHKWAKVPRLVQPTKAAINWLKGKTEVSTHVFLYDKKMVGVTARTMSFKEHAGRKYYNLQKRIEDLPDHPKRVQPGPRLKLRPKG
jgi:hypothetical protein